MSVNRVPQRPTSRQPRALVRVNGIVVPGWVSWTVTQNSFYEADTFRVSYVVRALPTSYDAAWFSRQSEVTVEVFAGFPQDPAAPHLDELTSLIYGRVDSIDFDPVAGTLELTGRDLTAAFIDARLADEWPNKTASQIATDLAGRHGLTPVVTATSAKSGTFYKADQMRMRADQSEWDLLAYLARESGYVCYVRGTELHFEPDERDASNPFAIQFDKGSVNVQSIRFSHSMTVAKGVSVTVRSASRKSKTAVTQSYPTHAKSIQAGKSSPFGNVQNYFFTMAADSTPAQAAAYAQRMYTAIVEHAMVMEARMPAADELTQETAILVSGTGTAFDQVYYPREIIREMSMDAGYTMSVRAQNYSPDLAP